MTAEEAITFAYLAVSGLSLLVQARHLHRMREAKAGHGLTRTAWCRVGCSVLYVLVGVNALAVHWAVIQTTFAVYATTAVTWWINSILDDRLTRPPRTKRPKRRPFQFTVTFGRAPEKEVSDASSPPTSL